MFRSSFFLTNKYNAIFLSAECKLFHIPRLPAALGTSHACVSRENYENKSRNYSIVGFLISGVEASKVTK